MNSVKELEVDRKKRERENVELGFDEMRKLFDFDGLMEDFDVDIEENHVQEEGRKIWQRLNELSKKNPQEYKKYIEKQLGIAKKENLRMNKVASDPKELLSKKEKQERKDSKLEIAQNKKLVEEIPISKQSLELKKGFLK
eukprot:snap_masked-scaffold_37-processed-gene-1.1-mRNA-1 protein AED:0.90 eAED:1.00 QI:0/-1/0/1/-1/1/1/0/139